MVTALRFFTIAPLHSTYMLAALATALLAGCGMLMTDPTKGAVVLVPLALVQMFASSSGFAIAARRGHLDLLLTAGPGRLDIALTHLVVSVMPGLFVWWSLGLVEAVTARTLHPEVFASGSAASLALVSILSWALTVRLPPLSGGLAWLLGIAVWLVGWYDEPPPLATLSDHVGGGTASSALLVMLCPFVLLGRRLSAGEAMTMIPAAAVAGVVAGCAIAWIARMDVPLESAQ